MGVVKSVREEKAMVEREASLVPEEVIQNKIYWPRGRKVILDKDLARLYGVSTSQLTRQVRRNIERFPQDFMMQMTHDEFNNLKCQFGTSSWGGTRKLPLAFTEQGVAMLSGVLHSLRAIRVNIQIMRVFVKLKEALLSHKDLAQKIEELELKFKDHDKKLVLVFEAIKQLLKDPSESSKVKEPIGFRAHK